MVTVLRKQGPATLPLMTLNGICTLLRSHIGLAELVALQGVNGCHRSDPF